MTEALSDHELYEKHFRVAIFGSARITKNDPIYEEVYKLAYMIAGENIDVVTGGGPGLMQAASKGHQDGRNCDDTCSIGLNIDIPAEQKPNRHLNIKKEFHRFSKRLDTFMILSDTVVVAPGGVGTLLEFAYAWQLVQVKHICSIPIILLGNMWIDFMKWVQIYPIKQGFISKKDLRRIFIAKDSLDAFRIIKKFYEGFQQGDDICLNFKKYKIALQKEGLLSYEKN
jgi:uncharacterized protein (TIGR00730 family)